MSPLFDPTPLWHAIELPPVTVQPTQPEVALDAYKDKISHAKKLLKEENEKVDLRSRLSSSDRSFVSNILTSGTLSDKVSALTLLVQESPLHSLKTLDTLMTMAKKKSRKEALMAVESLKDLFIGSVLPDRKLIYIVDRPLGSPEVEDRHLALWRFEDHLKKYYFQYIQQLEALSHDPLMHVRLAVVRCIYDLLAAKPEQEQNLLKLLVNKLGDGENKVASKASHLLVELLVAHPGMKMFVVREIEQLVLQPNVNERAQYYGMITLNQTILTSKETEVANKLIALYFVFFRRILKLVEEGDKLVPEKTNEKDKKKKKDKKKEKGNAVDVDEHQTKLIGAILTGVNRAFHFAKITDDTFEKHLNVLFQITHAGTFNTAIQALSLIFSISLVKPTVSDRFYRVLYESLLDSRLITTSKQTMYLNLLYKAVRADSDPRRVKAFVKRMIQIAAQHQPPFICGLFYLLSQLMETHKGVRAMLTTPEEDDEEEHFKDVPDEEDEQQQQQQEEDEGEEKSNNKNYYDGRKRDPRFSNADKSCLWELIPFKNHYHPTVAKYAEFLFKGEKIKDEPDMQNHTLIHFLDRFVYRNPKKNVKPRGGSMMQPLLARRDGGVTMTRNSNVDEVPVVSEEFWRKKIEDVPVDEIFFHKYFTQKRSGEALSEPQKKKKQKLDDDEENEDEVWRAMVSSMPGGLERDDEDDDLMDEDDEDEDNFDNEDDEDDEFDDEALKALLMDESDQDIGSDIELAEAPSDSE